jgi:pyruvate dehydrogenase E1 component alpha subunit
LAQKAWGYGAFGLQVDGNDALAVHTAVTEAVARAREGGGPSVPELETYRMGHHTTADDATRYRAPAELEAWKAKDPVLRFKKYLEDKGLWDAAKEAKLLKDAEAMVQAEVDAYESTPPPNPLNMFADNYARAPWFLIEQRAELEELLKTKAPGEAVLDLPPAEGRFP